MMNKTPNLKIHTELVLLILLRLSLPHDAA